MKLTKNQYFGTRSEMTQPATKGSSYSTTDTNEIYISSGSHWVLNANSHESEGSNLTEEKASSIEANSAKVGITPEQASDIQSNNSKVLIFC